MIFSGVEIQRSLHQPQIVEFRGVFQDDSYIYSLSRFPVLSEKPLALPAVTLPVRIWWDYSHRYGFAYLLHNSTCGACFNDSTRVLITPDESLAQYWDSPQRPAPEKIPIKGIEESPHRKKLLLIWYFASGLKQKAGELMAPPLRIMCQQTLSGT